MKSAEELATPSVLIDLDVLEANIARQAGRAREAGVRLRPHCKTHKSPEIAKNLWLKASVRFLFPTGKQSPFGSSQYQWGPAGGFIRDP